MGSYLLETLNDLFPKKLVQVSLVRGVSFFNNRNCLFINVASADLLGFSELG